MGDCDQEAPDALSRVDQVHIKTNELVISADLADGHRVQITAPFTERRRGVESKIIIPGPASAKRDLVLIRRIHRALTWVDKIKAGQTIKSIAEQEQISTDYVTHNLDLALLSPEILSVIAEGRQRQDITAASMIKRRWPVDWNAQNPAWIA